MNMFCVECGKPIEPDYRFCAYCGRPNVGMTKTGTTQKSSSQRTLSNRSTQRFALSLGAVAAFFLVAISVVVLLLIFKDEEVSKYKVSIINKVSPEDGDAWLQTCVDCKKVSIHEKDTTLDLPIEKDYKKAYSLRAYLVQQAQLYNGESGVLRLLHEDYPNRLLHLSFDISGSVQDLDKEDARRNASKVYSDLIVEKLKNVLASKENLVLPGDEVIVRLYGPTREDNPCREALHVKYIGPSWNAKFAYSNRTEEVSILVEEQVSPQIQQENGMIVINDSSLLVSTIGEFYKDALDNPNYDCHSETRLQNHLQDILDDTLQNKYDTINYILTNDGRFLFENFFITQTSYEVLYNFINTKTPFSIDNKTLCRVSEEKFIVIGMRYDDNLVYRRAVQEFFNTIFSPCEVKFYNA